VTTVVTSPSAVVRREAWFDRVESTNDVVRAWLAAGEPEICLAVAGEQTAGRGRSGRSWTAPPGRGLLLSVGFRPTWLSPDRAWRLAATVSLAMVDAAEEVCRLAGGTIRLKWPNDLVVEGPVERSSGSGEASTVRKLGGVLGETDGLGSDDPRAIVGIGVNADWPADEFPVELAESMTSLRAIANDRPVDASALLEAFRRHLETVMAALHADRFDVEDWSARQITTGRRIELLLPNGSTEHAVATGVDPASGALRLTDDATGTPHRSVVVGEIVHVRVGGM
jgi:BirA family biotin operon repressor/biotin-[acetyl-CoA-carboxylase] ligase